MSKRKCTFCGEPMTINDNDLSGCEVHYDGDSCAFYLKKEVERLKSVVSDRDKALEIARKEIGRLSFELDEMTEQSDHERKVAKTEIARMRAITEHAEKVVEIYEKIRRMEAAHKATDNSKQVFGPMSHTAGCPKRVVHAATYDGQCNCGKETSR